MANQILKGIRVSCDRSNWGKGNMGDITVSLSGIEIEKSLMSFFCVLHWLAFNFLHLFFFLFLFLFVVLLDVLPVNSLLFEGILTQLNTFGVDNMFFILILVTCIYL